MFQLLVTIETDDKDFVVSVNTMIKEFLCKCHVYEDETVICNYQFTVDSNYDEKSIHNYYLVDTPFSDLYMLTKFFPHVEKLLQSEMQTQNVRLIFSHSRVIFSNVN